MARIAQHFKSGTTDYAILRKGDRPLVVESSQFETALLQGAQSYPLTCNSDLECWLEIPDEHYRLLQEEMDWVLE
jgi:hypothetical protein